MSDTSDYTNVFNSQSIHARWISAYRTNTLQDAFNNTVMRSVLTLMELPDGARVLDAGCGTGEHSIRLAIHKLNVVGVDLSESVLQKARSVASEQGVHSVEFLRSDITNLSIFSDGEFDAVHCRGVLMHLPQWECALAELCRVLKPGGRIAIFENNHRSLELKLVRLARLLRRSESVIVKTSGGIEFRPVTNPAEPLTRIANIGHLIESLAKHEVSLVKRLATEFWDIARWPSGPVRNSIIRFNHAWFSCHLPSQLSLGNLIVGIKNP